MSAELAEVYAELSEVFAVMGTNYEDVFVESVWATRKLAEKRAGEAPGEKDLGSYSFHVDVYEVKS